jgi:putative membrane protein
MAPFFAFLHHVAAFTLVSALGLEFVLIRSDLTLKSARQIQAADVIFGVSVGVILVVGLLRVFYFEKGAAYYFHSIPFMIKFTLFVLVALLSIYPTREFLSWRESIGTGKVPVLSQPKRRTIRMIIHMELAGILLLILCAALMAKGVGYRA